MRGTVKFKLFTFRQFRADELLHQAEHHLDVRCIEKISDLFFSLVRKP